MYIYAYQYRNCKRENIYENAKGRRKRVRKLRTIGVYLYIVCVCRRDLSYRLNNNKFAS